MIKIDEKRVVLQKHLLLALTLIIVNGIRQAYTFCLSSTLQLQAIF